MIRISPVFLRVAVGMTLVVAWAASPIMRIEEPTRGTEFVKGSGPLACRFSFGHETRKRTSMDHLWVRWLLGRPTQPRLRNPLIGDLIRVEVGNMSGRDVAVYDFSSGTSRPFRFDVQILDERGGVARWPDDWNMGGLKQLVMLPEIPEVVTIGPGRSVVRSEWGWRFLVAAKLRTPGDYDIRVICTYETYPDGVEHRIQSAPVRITVTEDELREWRDSCEPPDAPAGEPA